MKKIFTFLVPILFTVSVFAQSPEKMSYQAVMRDASDNLITDTQVGMRISILQGSASGTAVYIETQNPATNANGLITIEIGAGTTSDDFSAIDWANGPFFIKTETDPAGGTNYTITGTSQLMSVPYALHAKTAENVKGGITETDPLFNSSVASGISADDTANWNAASVGTFNELDPMFTSSEAANITATDITNLGNLSGTNTGDQDISGIATNEQAIQDTAAQIRADIPDVSGFLTTESDPAFTGSEAANITATDITNLGNLSGSNTGDQDISGIATNEQAIQDTAAQIRADIPDVSGFVTSETDPAYTSSEAANITATDITNLGNLSGTNTGDQDLSTLASKTALGDSTAKVRSEIPDVSGFITSESDPAFNSSVASGISATDTANWNAASVGTFNELDPTYTSSEAANITATDITNLGNLSGTNTGDQDISGIATNEQAIQDTAAKIRADIPDVSGFLTSETDPEYSSWDKSTGISITESQISDLGSYLTAETDSSTTNEIQVISISNDTIYLSDGGFAKLPESFSGSFNDLSDVPANLDTDSTDDFDGQYSSLSGAPTNVSDFTNDAGYLTSEGDSVASSSTEDGTYGLNSDGRGQSFIATQNGKLDSISVMLGSGTTSGTLSFVVYPGLGYNNALSTTSYDYSSSGLITIDLTQENITVYKDSTYSFRVIEQSGTLRASYNSSGGYTDGTWLSATGSVYAPWDWIFTINYTSIPAILLERSAINEQAIQDTAAQIRADMPDIPSGNQAGDMQYWNGTAWVIIAAAQYEGAALQMIGGVPTWVGGTIPNVTNPTTGEIWMDRNLGASQVATSSTDADAYGDLYQWGRAADGHESRTSGTTTTLATSDTPGHGDFITNGSSPYDWRNPQNDNLWQGVSGTNNPCPSGYRLPTEAEWEAERTSWSSNDAAGAFASPLKLPVAGFRDEMDGSINNVGSAGYCWSSTVDSNDSRHLYFGSSTAGMFSNNRANGYSIRCIKD